MVERENAVQHRTSSIRGLFHKIQRSFKEVQFDDHIEVTNVGSSLWRKSAGKLRYLKLMLAVTRNRNKDITTPFSRELYGGVTDFLYAVDSTFVDSYVNGGLLPRQRFMNKLYEPNSFYSKPMHVNAISQYYNYRKKREIEPIPSGKGLNLYREHRSALLRHWDTVSKMGPEDLVTFIEPNVNIGADLWVTQNKKNFVKHFQDVTSRWWGKAYDFTVHGILNMCTDGITKDIHLPVTAFYRGKDTQSIRAVFGGDVALKAIGTVIQALKSVEKVQYPKIASNAKLPWGPWTDWSDYFPKLTPIIDACYEKESLNAVGEDFVKFDTQIRPEDLRTLVDPINDKLSPIYNYVMQHLDNNRVYLGPYSIKDLYYISGHPFTSELASGWHAELAFQYEADSEATIVDGSVNSDDNMIIWRDIDVQDYYQWLGRRGYEVKIKGSSNLTEHGYVRFLQNDIGRIRKGDDDSIFVGAFDSRYPKMIHLETGGDTMNWEITGDLEIDRMVSKLGSFGEHGTEMVEAILALIRNNNLGRRVIQTIKNMSDYEVTPKRGDIVGFHPRWLSRCEMPDITL